MKKVVYQITYEMEPVEDSDMRDHVLYDSIVSGYRTPKITKAAENLLAAITTEMKNLQRTAGSSITNETEDLFSDEFSDEGGDE